jgi:hypothetical protein
MERLREEAERRLWREAGETGLRLGGVGRGWGRLGSGRAVAL